MTTRQVTLRVVCDLPENISVIELKEYVQDAVRVRGGAFHPEDNFFDSKLRKNMKVLGKYKRRVL